MARTKFCELRDTVVAKPGATERLAALRVETVEEIRFYELRHGEAISQVELAIRIANSQLRTPDLYAALTVVAVLGIALFFAVKFLERLILGHRRHRAASDCASVRR